LDIAFTSVMPRWGESFWLQLQRNLTPGTLELGNKNPVIVPEKSKIEIAVKMASWGKHFGAGQLCLAPEYAFMRESVLVEFVDASKKVRETLIEV
jgi:coniferyl-aldehyde dehydrogenase